MPDIDYLFGDYRLVTAARELWRNGDLMPTPRLVFDCLLYLIRHRDRAVGRDELVAAVWGRVDATDGQVNQLMLRVRRAFGDDAQMQNAIRTVPGFGYRWVIDVANGTSPTPTQTGTTALGDAGAPEMHEFDGTERPESPPPSEAATAKKALATTAKRSTHRYRVLFVAIAVALVAGAWAYALLGKREPIPRIATNPISKVTVVLPLEVSAPRDAGWVRLGAMDLVAERMREAGIPVPPSENVLMASRGAGDLASTDGRSRLERALGAEMVVVGKATLSSLGWKVELNVVTPDATSHRMQAENPDVIEASRQATDLLLASLGRTPPDAGEKSPIQERAQQIDAALLANELDTARSILAAIPKPERDEVQFQYLGAQIDIRAGQFASAQASLTSLLDDPRVLADPTMNARVFSSRGTVHGRRAECAEAERDFDAAVQRLKSAQSPSDLGRALNGRGTSRIGLRKFDDAVLDFGQAHIEYAKAGDRLGIAQTDTNLGLLEAERGRLEQALPYLTGAVERFEALGAVERELSVMIPLFDTQTLLLRWEDALRTSDRQFGLRDRASDPGLGVQIALNRCIALLGMGREREAEALFTETNQHFTSNRPDTIRYLRSFEATLAARQGRNEQAATAAAAALKEWPKDLDSIQRGVIELIRQRALIATGKATDESIGPPPPTSGADADSDDIAPALFVAAAEWSAYRKHNDDAEEWFRRGRLSTEKTGVPAQMALMATAYTKWLLDHHRENEASAIAGRVAPWAEHDFDCALLQVEVLHARGQRDAWFKAYHQALAVAGERSIPVALSVPPAS
jgi:DNA-binding winged helix-turn-helix (wHTH) protein/tetratricopeptide (TPR) repeat protein